jgi:hypothetical protein
MNNQLEIDLPNDYESSEGYLKAISEFVQIRGRKDLQPIFLCYNTKTKQFFVSKIFKLETIESYKYKIIQKDEQAQKKAN